MIQSIEIKNFKSIKRKYFTFRNLNILLGLNGMGKSSLIQNLLAFRQSKSLSSGRLDLRGEYVKIGSTKDAYYQYAKKLPFATHIKFSNKQEIDLVFDYKIDADFFTGRHAAKEPFEARDMLEVILSKESLFNDNFQYLNANRIEPQSINLKNYSQVVELKNIGSHGEYTAHYIDTFGNEDILLDNLIHPSSIIEDKESGTKIVVKSLINQVNLWMGEISPNVNLRTTSISSDNVLLEYVYKQPNLGNTNRFKPENVGFGITYSLPIVVSLLKAKPGDLIIIENPESHVHPKGQAQLGKLMALAAMNGVQIIVETHSDHIINGVRVAVKQELIGKDKVVIYYFEKIIRSDEQYSIISNIEIDKNGTLSEYPTDMLDEWSNQLFNLM
jgi:predicted ATPase